MLCIPPGPAAVGLCAEELWPKRKAHNQHLAAVGYPSASLSHGLLTYIMGIIMHRKSVAQASRECRAGYVSPWQSNSWSGREGLGLALSPHPHWPGILGKVSHGPRATSASHQASIPPSPVLSLHPVCIRLLSALRGLLRLPLLKQCCWQLSEQAHHSVPSFLPCLLLLLILNTARRFAWFIILERALTKSSLLNQLVCVCVLSSSPSIFCKGRVCDQMASIWLWKVGFLSNSKHPLLGLPETGRWTPDLSRDRDILSKWGHSFSPFLFFRVIPFVLWSEISPYSSSPCPQHHSVDKGQRKPLCFLTIIMASNFWVFMMCQACAKGF